jgi:ribosome-associated heat shock protein Hsp15
VTPTGGPEPAPHRERLDRFLVFSRLVKTRTLAQHLIEEGHVRLNGKRTESADRKVGAGDVLTIMLGERLVVWRILDPGTRRGPASGARTLYEDLSPVPPPPH